MGFSSWFIKMYLNSENTFLSLAEQIKSSGHRKKKRNLVYVLGKKNLNTLITKQRFMQDGESSLLAKLDPNIKKTEHLVCGANPKILSYTGRAN